MRRSAGRSPAMMRLVDASASADWADNLINLVRTEVDDAARRGVITVGESEQLVARLVLVIDQALSGG